MSCLCLLSTGDNQYENPLNFLGDVDDVLTLFSKPVRDALPTLAGRLFHALTVRPENGVPPPGTLLPDVISKLEYLIDRCVIRTYM